MYSKIIIFIVFLIHGNAKNFPNIEEKNVVFRKWFCKFRVFNYYVKKKKYLKSFQGECAQDEIW